MQYNYYQNLKGIFDKFNLGDLQDLQTWVDKLVIEKKSTQPVKKTIIIEIEAKNEKNAKWAVDYITCDIKKENWVDPDIKVKVNIKEEEKNE